MFERSLRLWIRLYPREFREHYGEEIGYVIRDRLRESRSLLARLAVGMAVASDLLYSLPRCYVQQRSKVLNLESIPLGFRPLEQSKPGSVAIVFSTVLSLILLEAVRSLHCCPQATGADVSDRIRSLYQAIVHLLH